MKTFRPRQPTRLRTYDYSHNGHYFITLCTGERQEYFGSVKNNEMILNQYGRTAANAWLDLPNHHKCIQLDQFIVMPNHIHGIIIINNPVVAGPARPLHDPGRSCNNNLSIIVGSFKSTVAKQINRSGNNQFRWQRSFYDHIVRTDRSLKNIREYIVNNPLTWDDDENNIKNFL